MENENGAWVVASETCAFEVVGADWVRDVEPGEIVVIDDSGIQYDSYTRDTQLAVCSMEYVYFARPDSVFTGSMSTRPEKYGTSFGQNFNMKRISWLVCQTPPICAMGFAEESGLPNEMGLIKTNIPNGHLFSRPRNCGSRCAHEVVSCFKCCQRQARGHD